MKTIFRNIFAGITLMAAAAMAQAGGEVVQIGGQTFMLEPPPGYCTLGKSPIERRLFEFQKRSSAGSGELAQLAVDCKDLQKIIEGKADMFNRWVMTLVLLPKGQYRPITMPRREYVRAIAAQLRGHAINHDELNRRTQSEFDKAGDGVKVTTHDYREIPSGEDAALFEMNADVRIENAGGAVYGIGGLTVVNQLPIGVYSYSTPGISHEQTQEAAKAYVRLILSKNK